MVLTQAEDYRNECEVLDGLLAAVAPSQWNEPTQFKHWTFCDVVGHLHMFDRAALLTLSDPEGFSELIGVVLKTLSDGKSMRDCTRAWLGELTGPELLMRWRQGYLSVGDLYAAADPARRVAWAGPSMSARSCISARQMETWAHGQALFDAVGRERRETDSLKNIAVMGINTFGWAFTNRGLEVPPVRPFVRLKAPSGAFWEWCEPSASERIEGTAVDFCRVVTQTRNVTDTALAVTGPIAQRWMLIAQCFAGPAENPPPPGTRCQRVS